MNNHGKRKIADPKSIKLYDDYWKSLERKPEEEEIQKYVKKVKEIAEDVEAVGRKQIGSLADELLIRFDIIELLGRLEDLRSILRESTGKKVEENGLLVENKYVVGDVEIIKASAYHLKDPKRYKDAALLILNTVPDRMKQVYLSPNLSSIKYLSDKGNATANKLLEEFAKDGIEIADTAYYKFMRLPKEKEK